MDSNKMNDIQRAFSVVSLKDFKTHSLGKEHLIKNNQIGYSVTTTIVKLCFDIMCGKPLCDDQSNVLVDKVDPNDLESIKRVYEEYKKTGNGSAWYLKNNNVEIDDNSLAEIGELIRRIVDYINGKNIVHLFDSAFLLDDDMFTIAITIQNFNLNRCAWDAANSLKLNREKIKDKIDRINRWIIYNPRFDKEYVCDLKDSLEAYEAQAEYNRKAEIKKHQDYLSQFEPDDIDIEPFEFDMLYDEEFRYEDDPDKQYVFDHVLDIKRKLDIPFKDAFYIFADDVKVGITHGKNDIVFDGVLYTSKNELYRVLFPEHTLDAIHSAITYKIRRYGVGWEKAVHMILEDPPDIRKKEIVYNGRKFKSYQNLFKVYFPKRKYANVYAAVKWLMKKKDISFEDAVKEYIEDNKSSFTRADQDQSRIVSPSLQMEETENRQKRDQKLFLEAEYSDIDCAAAEQLRQYQWPEIYDGEKAITGLMGLEVKSRITGKTGQITKVDKNAVYVSFKKKNEPFVGFDLDGSIPVSLEKIEKILVMDDILLKAVKGMIQMYKDADQEN